MIIDCYTDQICKIALNCFYFYATLFMLPNPYSGIRKGVLVIGLLISFLVSVGAGIVAYYICKWLDGD